MRLTGYYPTDEALDKLVRHSSKKIAAAMESDDLAIRHNAFTDYTLALLFSATGHRPVIDPIHSKKLFDLDQGWLLIADKVVHEERAWRVTALPPVARLQLQYYLDYLPRLASWLDQNPLTSKTRDQVLGLTLGHEQIPFFFYLDFSKNDPVQSIAPNLMASRWRSYWQLPINFLRHVAATEIAISSQQARLAQIQLGHFTGSDHPFGVTACQSAQFILEQISQHSEVVMHRIGWQAIRSPLRQPKGATPLVFRNLDNTPSKTLGAQKRFRQRQVKRSEASGIVRTAIQYVAERVGLSEIEQIRLVEKKIATDAPVSLTNTCLRLFYRYVSKRPGGARALSKSGLSRVIKVEESPFKENSIHLYQQAVEIRHKFLHLLDQRLETEPDHFFAIRAAEITVSAALFSHFGNTQRLQSIADALLHSTYQYDGKLFLDLPVSRENGSPVVRWFPDEVSQLLIQGLYSKKNHENISPGQLQRALTRLLSQLIEFDKKLVWEKLAEIGRSLNLFELPGHSAAFLNGMLNSISVPLQQWVRMLSGQALKLATPTQTGQMELPQLPVPDCSHTPSQKKSREFLYQLRQLFTESVAQPPQGNRKVSTVRKRHLETLIRARFGPDTQGWPQLPLLIAAWALHLCQNGTRAKADLAFNTIEKYTFMVARALLAASIDGDFLAFEPEAYENIYLEILEAQPESRKPDVAGRLYEFHRFLASVYAAQQPAWTAIFRMANLENSTAYADANLVSEQEYLHIFTVVSRSDYLDSRERTQYLVLLMLGYRFGLRFGEAHSLLYRDVQFSEDGYTITVRGNIHSDTKSSAGQRIIPLLEQLTEPEHIAFAQLLGWARAHAENDPLAALMAQPGDARHLIDKHQTASILGQYIKQITGDPSLRFHHLRHSWATRLYAYHYSDAHQLAGTSVCPNKWSTFVGKATCYPLSSIATAIGHLHETTTLTHYIHSIESSCSGMFTLESLPVSTKAYAYALCINHDNARQRARRGTLLNLTGIPQPNISLQPRPQEIESKKLDVTKFHLAPFEIEQFLLRLRETHQPANVIANELFIESSCADKVLKLASRIERSSGFEFYQVEISHNDELLINTGTRKKIREALSRQKSYALQNRNIILALQEMYSIIKQLNAEEYITIKDALELWQTSSSDETITLYDKDSLRKIRFLLSTLLPEIQIEIQPSNTVRSTKTPNTLKDSGSHFKLVTDGFISTQQMLKRLLFVLLVYFSQQSR
jgi:integrase